MAVLAAGLSCVPLSAAENVDVVQNGKAVSARFTGKAWDPTPEGLVAEGTERFIRASNGLDAGDFRVRAKLMLERLDGSAASFMIDDNQVGFDGRSGTLFFEGPLFGGTTQAGVAAAATLKPRVPFVFEALRERGTTRFLIDGVEIRRKEQWDAPVRSVGFRPWRNRMTISGFSIAGNLIQAPAPPAPLFASGTDGYHTYRIPALAVTKTGTVLAICEGRKNSSNDSGKIDLLVKRSTDHGKTWSHQKVIWEDAGNTCGNPCVVVDRETGGIFLLSTWNRGDDHEGAIIARTSKDGRRVFVMHSTNDGLTWGKPREITADVKKPDWTWYATGPGSGIQIEQGPHKGRLVIPCDHIEAETKRYYSHVIYSDDHGATWKLGGTTPQYQVNECEVVELTGGKLMLNMRNYQRSKCNRQTAISDDAGLTWRDQTHDPALVEPICQAAIERYCWPRGAMPGVILFSNPASTRSRVNLTLRASFDDAKSWPHSQLLFAGPSGYSDLAVLSNGKIACLYEGGASNIAESIIFTAISLESLTKDAR